MSALNEENVEAALEAHDIQFKDCHRYYTLQCPLHEDRNASAQLYKDDWYLRCNAGCDGDFIDNIFKELRNGKPNYKPIKRKEKEVKIHNFIDLWRTLPNIPSDYNLKGLPPKLLHNHGWRLSGESIFIPYWDDKITKIPYYQLRHPKWAKSRFSSPKGVIMPHMMYGIWNAKPGSTVHIVEGTSDGMVMEHCGVNWVSALSAGHPTAVKKFCKQAEDNNITVVYVGDNDGQGDSLKRAITIPFKYRPVPARYKDVGEFFEAEGKEAVQKYFKVDNQPTELEQIQAIFPGAELLIDEETKGVVDEIFS